MGRVRTKTVKRAAKAIVEKYYAKLNVDFHSNKKVCDDVAVIQTKRLRNKIAGYATHLMKRIQKGPVQGISLKVQEEERARRMEEIGGSSSVNTDFIQIDKDTKKMLNAIDMGNLPGVAVQSDAPVTTHHGKPKGGRHHD
mmetsp:Transcript_21785/g.24649  ORF Transcript_21785/g.24649 Transcript_21785/m.24649 type:complete len:140 (-) Transcript_21785:320-739(-)